MERRTILVVEDDPDLRIIFRATLERAGYEVLTASDGSEALEILETDGELLRLVVADVVMPNVGGRELLWRAAQLFPDLPVVLVSGIVNEDTVHLHSDERADLFLQKPVEPRELVLAIDDLMNPHGKFSPARV